MKRINITIPDEIYEKILKYKKGILQINISKICTKAIKNEFKKLGV